MTGVKLKRNSPFLVIVSSQTCNLLCNLLDLCWQLFILIQQYWILLKMSNEVTHQTILDKHPARGKETGPGDVSVMRLVARCTLTRVTGPLQTTVSSPGSILPCIPLQANPQKTSLCNIMLASYLLEFVLCRLLLQFWEKFRRKAWMTLHMVCQCDMTGSFGSSVCPPAH